MPRSRRGPVDHGDALLPPKAAGDVNSKELPFALGGRRLECTEELAREEEERGRSGKGVVEGSA
eukprot:6140778-Alexandrium_andersonii.AAC.1